MEINSHNWRCHIYCNHEEALKKQLERKPLPFPLLHIKNRDQKKVEDYDVSDFIITGYDCHPGIKMKMAV